MSAAVKTYVNPIYPYVRSRDQDAGPVRHGVIVVGAGPIGLAAAIDLAQRGVPVVVLDEDDTVSVGSRAICYAKRTLEILDRLGVGQRVVDKGIGWNVGKVFFRDALAYRFDLLPEAGHRRPAFVNLQQYWLEEYLVDRARELPAIDLRWKNRVDGVAPAGDHVELVVDTPDGPYTLHCDWLIVCDGAQQPRAADARTRGGRAGVPRPLPDRGHPDEVGLPDRALVLVRPAVPSRTSRCCCTGRPTTSGASTSSWAGTPTPRRRSGPSESCRGCARCSGPRRSSRSSGRASTRSSAGACRRSGTAA